MIDLPIPIVLYSLYSLPRLRRQRAKVPALMHGALADGVPTVGSQADGAIEDRVDNFELQIARTWAVPAGN